MPYNSKKTGKKIILPPNLTYYKIIIMRATKIYGTPYSHIFKIKKILQLSPGLVTKEIIYALQTGLENWCPKATDSEPRKRRDPVAVAVFRLPDSLLSSPLAAVPWSLINCSPTILHKWSLLTNWDLYLLCFTARSLAKTTNNINEISREERKEQRLLKIL